MTLATLRLTGGSAAVKRAIVRAIATHGATTAAARSLGTTISNLQRACQRVGVEWPARPRGRPRKA